MKKILCSIVFLMLVNFTASSVIAQFNKQNKFQKRPAEFTKTESVSFSRAEAFSDGNGVLIRWTTESEDENLGFNIFRIDNNKSVKVNFNIVPGTYLRFGNDFKQGNVYTFFDTQGTFNSAYRIETFTISGRNTSTGKFYTKFESNLKGLGGASSQELQRSMREAYPVKIEKNPNLPAGLKREIEANGSLTDFDMQRWVAAQPGVKIGVKSEGFYRVTVSELQTGGFDTNTDPTNWQLYLNGIQQAINVVAGSHIEFYGKAVDTIDSETGIYFLINGPQPGKRIADTFRRRVGGFVVAPHYDYTFKRRDRAVYTSTILNGERENFYGAVMTPTAPGIVNFEVDGMDFSTQKSKLFVELQGLTLVAHQVQVKLNGEILGVIGGSNRNLFTGNFDVPISLLQNGTNTLEFLPLNASDINLVSSFRVDYKRFYKAIQNQLPFYTRNMNVTNVSGFTSPNVRIFDTTYQNEPELITNVTVEPANKQGTEYNVHIPANRTRQMFAVEDSALKQVSSIVQNHPSTIGEPTNAADLIIITHRDWLTESNAWAAYRQNDGLTVEVMDVEDVYDEFDYGVKGSRAIKNFLQYAKNNRSDPPDYILLMGDASYDPKNYTGTGGDSFVPMQFIDTQYEETGSDEGMADFDNDGLAEIAIGRIPARNPQEITTVLSKVNDFESTLPTAWGRGALCASDLPNGYDFEGKCVRVSNQLPASIPKTYVNRGQTDAKTVLLNAMNSGKYIVNYSGHGNAGAWVNSSFFHTGDVPTLTNQNNLSIFTMLTCLNGYFIRPQVDSLSEVLLKTPEKGAVVVWASAGQTTPDVQEILASRFFNQLGTNPNMIRIGDLVKDAKANLNGGRDVRLSWALLGDPTLKVK